MAKIYRNPVVVTESTSTSRQKPRPGGAGPTFMFVGGYPSVVFGNRFAQFSKEDAARWAVQHIKNNPQMERYGWHFAWRPLPPTKVGFWKNVWTIISNLWVSKNG